jgi:tol-pal system protein YbgF
VNVTMPNGLRTVALAVALFIGATAPVKAGLFDDEEARKRIADLRTQVEAQQRRTDERLTQLDESIKGLGVVELLRQIELLKEEMARLRGQIEVLVNNDEQINKRQRDFYLDLDSRLKRLEAGTAQPSTPSPATGAPAQSLLGQPALPVVAAQLPAVPAAPVGPTAGTSARPGTALQASASPGAPTNAQSELRAYEAASNLFKKNDFTGAVNAFMGFIAEFGQSNLVPNAYYWIGISHANLKDYKAAMAAQETVVRRYADSSKAPDALLAIAQLQSEQGDAGSARDTLDGLINRYPQSDAAVKARARLPAARR